MARTPSTMAPLGMALPPFELPDVVRGEQVGPDGVAAAPALLVAFLCPHCPFVVHIRPAFADFAREYEPRGLAVLAISSNDPATYPQDGPEGMRQEAREAGYTFPYLFDESQEVAKAFTAACTPDFFLFDRERRLVYRGQFDASRPGNEVAVTGSDLRRAVESVLAGERPDEAQSPSIGCNIKWRAGNEPAYFG